MTRGYCYAGSRDETCARQPTIRQRSDELVGGISVWQRHRQDPEPDAQPSGATNAATTTGRDRPATVVPCLPPPNIPVLDGCRDPAVAAGLCAVVLARDLCRSWIVMPLYPNSDFRRCRGHAAAVSVGSEGDVVGLPVGGNGRLPALGQCRRPSTVRYGSARRNQTNIILVRKIDAAVGVLATVCGSAAFGTQITDTRCGRTRRSDFLLPGRALRAAVVEGFPFAVGPLAGGLLTETEREQDDGALRWFQS
jgi:hypothetical protein